MKELLQDSQYALMEGMMKYMKESIKYYKAGVTLVSNLEPDIKRWQENAKKVVKLWMT